MKKLDVPGVKAKGKPQFASTFLINVAERKNSKSCLEVTHDLEKIRRKGAPPILIHNFAFFAIVARLE